MDGSEISRCNRPPARGGRLKPVSDRRWYVLRDGRIAASSG